MQFPSLGEAKEYIYSIDFSKIIDKLVKFNGWLKKDAGETCKLYRNFLFLNKKYEHQYSPLPPSEDIDEFWHNHILDTEKYALDCQAIFGKFFHHYPYLGIDERTNLQDLSRAFEITQHLYLLEFGERIQATKSRFPKSIYFLIHRFSLSSHR